MQQEDLLDAAVFCGYGQSHGFRSGNVNLVPEAIFRGNAATDGCAAASDPCIPAPPSKICSQLVAHEFVPADFTVPRTVVLGGLRLEPLGPEHNASDYAAWTSSIDHIRATPGFPWGDWPAMMTPAANLRDLEMHAEDFRLRKGFTYSVLDVLGNVVGCVYIYPSKTEGADAQMRSWVTQEHADMDLPLAEALRDWLRTDWPFGSIDYRNA